MYGSHPVQYAGPASQAKQSGPSRSWNGVVRMSLPTAATSGRHSLHDVDQAALVGVAAYWAATPRSAGSDALRELDPSRVNAGLRLPNERGEALRGRRAELEALDLRIVDAVGFRLRGHRVMKVVTDHHIDERAGIENCGPDNLRRRGAMREDDVEHLHVLARRVDGLDHALQPLVDEREDDVSAGCDLRLSGDLRLRNVIEITDDRRR